MSNKQKLMMINRVIEKTGLQVGSPLWYELIALTVEGVNNAIAEPSLIGEIHLLITPSEDADTERIEKELKDLFNKEEYNILGGTVYVVVMTE